MTNTPASILHAVWGCAAVAAFALVMLGANRPDGGTAVPIAPPPGTTQPATGQPNADDSQLLSTARKVTSWIDELVERRVRGGAPVFGVRVLEPAPSADKDTEPSVRPGAPMIVLVHGLDDPGWAWLDLIPALQAAGYRVARFEYPNDAPIAQSADLLAAELARLKLEGEQHVTIIAHSMGGLVTRDALTRPGHYASNGAGNERLPAVERFIMVGTPNKGSEMARMRGLAEARETLIRALQGDAAIDNGLHDGHGEAGADLIPGSTFLTELNARPAVTGTRITSIAGTVSPVESGSVTHTLTDWIESATSGESPAALRDLVGGIEDLDALVASIGTAVDRLDQMVGDGLVSVESTRVEGVEDHVVVSGNHLSIIMHFGDDHAPPPAVAVILDRLAADDASRGNAASPAPAAQTPSSH